MLPFVPRRFAETIGRPRFGDEGSAFPPFAHLAAEAKGAGRVERDADHIAKHRAVAVPANGSTRRIFGDQRLLERGCVAAGKPRGQRARRQQERRDWIGPFQPTGLPMSKEWVQINRADAALGDTANKEQ